MPGPKILTPFRQYLTWTPEGALLARTLSSWDEAIPGIVSGRLQGGGERLCVCAAPGVATMTGYSLDPQMPIPRVIEQLDRARRVLEAHLLGCAVPVRAHKP